MSQDNPNMNYKCRICGRVLNTSGGIRIHIRRVHQQPGTVDNIEETTEPVDVSPYPGGTGRTLKTDQTIYKCKICGREGIARSTQVHIIQGHKLQNWKEQCFPIGKMAEPAKPATQFTKPIRRITRSSKVPFAKTTMVECQVTLEIPLVIGEAVLKRLVI